MHPNEVQMVFKTDSGNIIPTKAYGVHMSDAIMNMTPEHENAITIQGRRQMEALKV